MRLVGAIIALIAVRSTAAFLLLGKHPEIRFYFNKVICVRDIFCLMIVYVLVKPLLKTYEGLVVRSWFGWYVLTFSVIMLHPFTPVQIYNENVIIAGCFLFNVFWLFSAFCLSIYAYIYRKELLA